MSTEEGTTTTSSATTITTQPKDNAATTSAAFSTDTHQQAIKDIIKKGVYEFEYIDGPNAGKKVQLERKKISVAKMIELEKIRGEYTVIIMRSNSENDKSAIENRLKASEVLSSIYAKCAEYYFQIKYEDFILMDWDSAKINLDAATNISIVGRPN